MVSKFNFHYAVRYARQQVFCIVTVSPTNNRGEMLTKSLSRPTKTTNKKKVWE